MAQSSREFNYLNLENELNDLAAEQAEAVGGLSEDEERSHPFEDDNDEEDDDENENGSKEEDGDSDGGESAFLPAYQGANTLFGASVREIFQRKGASSSGTAKQRTGKTAGKILPPSVLEPLTKAYEAYARQDLETATEYLSTCARLAPRLPDPYYTMAMMHEDNGNLVSATQLFFMAAYHSSTKAIRIWEKVAELALKTGEIQQALFALNRLIHRKPCVRYYLQKMRVLVEHLYDEKNAFRTAKKIIQSFPDQGMVALLAYAEGCLSLFLYEHAFSVYIPLVFSYILPSNVEEAELSSKFKSSELLTMYLSSTGQQRTTLQSSSELGYVLEACSRAADTLLQMNSKSASRDALILTRGVIHYMERRIDQHTMAALEAPSIPLDLLLMHGVTLLRGRSKVEDIATACRLTLPLLCHWETPTLSGAWDETATECLYRQRLSLARELISVGMKSQANSSLTSLEGELDIINRMSISSQIDLWCGAGNALLASQKVDQALDAFQKAYEMDPQNPVVILGILQCSSLSSSESISLLNDHIRELLHHLELCNQSHPKVQEETKTTNESVVVTGEEWRLHLKRNKRHRGQGAFNFSLYSLHQLASELELV